MTKHLDIGKRGEEIAQTYLQSLGYKLYDCNVRIGRDEIDLIMFDSKDNVLVFVEVKSRARIDHDFHPELGLTESKKMRIHRSANEWISEHQFEGGYRIDVVCVVDQKITEHLQEIDYQ